MSNRSAAISARTHQVLTVLGAMSTRGLLASMTIATPIDGAIFLAYVEQVLWRGFGTPIIGLH